MSKIICIYHGNCADGFGAAWAVRHALGEDGIEYYPGVYQQDPPDVAGKTVIMVDFSYKRDVIDDMAHRAKSILIIDHHKTAEAELQGFNDLVERDGGWLPDDGIWTIFDMNKSGAMLAWEYFNPGEASPQLLKHIQDRDLWKFEIEGTREIQAAVFSYPYDFDIWDELMRGDTWELKEQGRAIERKHHKDVAELVGVCERPMEIGGVVVPVASLPYTLVSDAAHMMAADHPTFAACYWDTAEARIFGLRSTESGMDVSEIAKQYGGGGHKHAAGFSVPRDHELARA